MFKLLAVFGASMVLAYISEKNTEAITASGRRYSVWNDWAYLLLVTILVLFAGLRTSYNDTAGYIYGARYAESLGELVRNPDFYNPFKVPLFHLFQSTIMACFDEPQCLVFFTSLITQTCFVLFIKRYSQNFVFSVFIFFTLGTYVFTLAALKQVLAMAILTLAFPCIEKKQWCRYLLFVFVAMLIHTYALAFAVIPLFSSRPWRAFTFVFIAIVMAVMLNFEEAITAFVDQANDLGKHIAEFEVFSDTTINIFRLAVYAVPPLISFLLQKWVLHDTNDLENTFIHMSIISLAFMTMGTQAGANMFGRMGNYFELGTICCLPMMLKKTFNEKSYQMISAVACICFIGFFVYANALHGNFDVEYQSVGLFEFVGNLLS